MTVQQHSENEWIEWAGDAEAPVAPDVRVQIMFRAGGTRTRKASSCDWRHRSGWAFGYDIIAYRLAKALGK